MALSKKESCKAVAIKLQRGGFVNYRAICNSTY